MVCTENEEDEGNDNTGWIKAKDTDRKRVYVES